MRRRFTVTWTSADDYKNKAASYGKSGDELDFNYAEEVANFGTPLIWQYESDETQTPKTLTLSAYFDGTLPTAGVEMESADSHAIEVHADDFRISATENTDYYICNVTYAGDTFSGTMYKRTQSNDPETDDSYTTLGTAYGTYSTSGKGISDCTITIKFTQLPSEVTTISTDTDYTLEQDTKSNTYTLQQ